jgi:hypothetical protein
MVDSDRIHVRYEKINFRAKLLASIITYVTRLRIVFVIIWLIM